MNWILDPFLSNTFMVRALIAGALVSVTCGVVGTYIVLRGLAFIGDALAHGVLPGVAIAILLGIPGIVGAAVSAAVMIGGIGLITRKSNLSSDTAIGLLFVSMLALGVIIVSRSSSFSGDLVRILFGEILGIKTWEQQVRALELIPNSGMAPISDLGDVKDIHPTNKHDVGKRLAMIALAVVISFQTVGTMLVFGMLLAPAGAAAMLAKRIRSMMLISSLIGIVSVFVGLLVSYYFNFSAGPSIVLVASVVFFLVLIGKNVQTSLRLRAEAQKHG